MACTHSAVMSVLARLRPASGTEDRVCSFAAAAARLLRAYTMQVEAYRRLRHGGDQHVRVKHVHINQGAQAVIENVRASERGCAQAPSPSAGGGGFRTRSAVEMDAAGVSQPGAATGIISKRTKALSQRAPSKEGKQNV
jgi:hypothetical protein